MQSFGSLEWQILTLTCPSCGHDKIYKHGKAKTGLQRYRCQGCQQYFQHEYHYEAHKPGVSKKIIDMAMNGSGVRNTSRVLGISATTVIAHLKNSPLRQ